MTYRENKHSFPAALFQVLYCTVEPLNKGDFVLCVAAVIFVCVCLHIYNLQWDCSVSPRIKRKGGGGGGD